MIKKTVILMIMSFSFFLLYSQTSDIKITSEISKTKIKIGEKITLTIKIQGGNFKDSKILWQEMNLTYPVVEIYSTTSQVKKNVLHMEITFTFFEKNRYQDFSFTIPINPPDAELQYLTTDKYLIEVEGELTDEEINELKNIKDPSKIELKPAKPQEKIPFQFSFIIKAVLIISGIIILILLLYFLFYQFIFKRKTIEDPLASLNPYEKFLARVTPVAFKPLDDRKIVETNLSILSEALKEMIDGFYDIKASSETTRELIMTLRNINFDVKLTQNIKNTFEEMDMIKFAKAPVDVERLIFLRDYIEKMGSQINLLFVKKNEETNQNENIKRDVNDNIQTG